MVSLGLCVHVGTSSHHCGQKSWVGYNLLWGAAGWMKVLCRLDRARGVFCPLWDRVDTGELMMLVSLRHSLSIQFSDSAAQTLTVFSLTFTLG